MKELTAFNPAPRLIYLAGYAIPPGASVKIPAGHVAAYLGNEKKIADAEASGIVFVDKDPSKDPKTRARHEELVKEAQAEGLAAFPAAYLSRALTSAPPDGSVPAVAHPPQGAA
jgi:hypothetical protein